MPLVTTLIDDKSPLIFYDSTWLPGTSGDDTYADQYYLTTFTTNNVTNGKATFTFNGTSFWIYSAKRNSHGTYTVQVDNASYTDNNGYSANNQFQIPIFNSSGLTQGSHTVSLINTGSNGQYVGVDLIVWQSEVGNTDDQLSTETVQDTDPRFQYSGSDWSASPSDANFFSNGTGHYTEAYQASATFTFIGASALLWTEKTLIVDYVKLDGGQATTYNGTAFLPFYSVTLYHADSLGAGQHQLSIINLPSTNGQALSIDYALVSTVSSSTSSTNTSQSLSTGAIAGIIVAGIVAALTTAATFFFYRKLKVKEAAYNHLCNVYMDNRRLDAPGAFSTSLEAATSTSLVRNTDSSPPSGYVPQPSNTDSPGASQLLISGASEAETRDLARRDQPQAPTSRRFRKRQGVGLPLLTESRRRQTRNERSEDRDSHPSISMSELPPNYTQAMQVTEQ